VISPAAHSGSPSGQPPTHRTLELNCLVQGDDFRNAFPVKIGSHESVDTLKQRIRKENEHAFTGVDAHNLVLWKVSIAADGLVKQDPRICDLSEDQSLLPTNRLSKVFSDALEEEHIHIVVRAPNTPCEPELFISQSCSHSHRIALLPCLLFVVGGNPASSPPSPMRGLRNPVLDELHSEAFSII